MSRQMCLDMLRCFPTSPSNLRQLPCGAGCPRSGQIRGVYPPHLFLWDFSSFSPAESAICGSWPADYAAHHSAIRQASAAAHAAHVELVKRTRRSKILAWFTAPPPHPYDRAIRFRTFEWLEGCGGYGDALNGLLFAFVTALLDGRALIVRHDCLPAAFLSAMIDCQLSDDVPLDPATVVPPLDYYGDGVVAARPPPAKAGEVVRLDLRNKRVELEIYFKELENATNIRVAANRGMLTHLATKAEGAWADRFKAMGIRLPYAVGCFHRFLLRPCDEVKELFHSTMQNLEAQKAPGSNSSSISSHVATLGIHIRVQDDVVWAGDRGAPKELSMQDVEALVGNAKQWLDCAAVRDWGGEGWAA
ncbi:unnamed protein product [Closterium sp. NIES-64]|nr:unnamed protein product [Closterium sp. NIES-64]CAI5985396.1 unnamed protein product [Closterium sp. NIES-64]